MFKIDCTGLTIREGRELATYLQSRNDVSRVRLDIDVDLTRMQTLVQMSIPHFYLLVHIAGVGAIAAGAPGDTGKEICEAVKGWMERFSEESAVSVEAKLYGEDGKLIDKVEKTR